MRIEMPALVFYEHAGIFEFANIVIQSSNAHQKGISRHFVRCLFGYVGNGETMLKSARAHLRQESEKRGVRVRQFKKRYIGYHTEYLLVDVYHRLGEKHQHSGNEQVSGHAEHLLGERRVLHQHHTYRD